MSEDAKQEPGQVSNEERAARLEWWKTQVANAPPWTPEQLAASKLIEVEMYDRNGLPKSL